jgi:hypothetical protein
MPPYSSDAPAAVDTSGRQNSNAKAHSNGATVTAAAGDVTLSSEQRQKNEDAYTQMGHTSDVLCIAWYVQFVTLLWCSCNCVVPACMYTCKNLCDHGTIVPLQHTCISN